jgi:spore germination protein YaaH
MILKQKGLGVLALSILLALSGSLLGSSISASASPSAASVAHGPAQVAPGRAAPHAGASALKREVFGFALASSLSDPAVGYPTWNFDLLSTVAFFGLHVQNDGTFAADNGKSVWDSSQLSALVSTAHSHGTKVVLTIILQDFAAGTPNMCAGLAHSATTVSNTVAEAKAKGVDGVNVDYEGLNNSCGTSDASWARHTLTGFVASLRSHLPAGSYLSVDTYASSATDPLGFFDVPGLSPSVDSFFVMAYDLEYSNYKRAPLSCPNFCLGPTAPLTGYYYNDTSTASQYAAAVPASKVILGVPYYGRKACVASATANQYPTGPVTADTYLDATGESGAPQVLAGSFASHRDANDPTGQERWDTWFNTSLNCTRELYWDDAASLSLKYDLVNQDGLRGVGIWNLNYGGGAPELWSALATHFAFVPGLAGNLNACAGNASGTVSWTAAPTQGGPVTSYQVTASPGGVTVNVPASTTIATISGLMPGTAYTFAVQAINVGGAGVGATTGPVTPVAAAPVFTSYLNWYDKASPGMVNDNIHLVDTGAAASSGCVTVSGKAIVPWSANPGQETYMTLPAGTIGGPVLVTVNSGPAVLASQRVQYNQSFNEVWAAGGAQAVTTSYFNWYDKASPGMYNDNIHVLNPGGVAANVTVSLPGATPQAVSVAPGAEAYVTFPAGKIGGPVTVSSSQPVMASQRVQYYQTFNEVWALSAAQAVTTSYFNWYDKASPGMYNDNIHLLNPGGVTANVTVTLPGAASVTASVAAGAETYVTFPAGKIAGPVKVSSTQPVLASQRVQYYSSFNEVPALLPATAATISHLNWYDKASPGMINDNIHLLNPGTASANVTVSLPGIPPLTVTVGAGAEAYVSFPAGTIGGAVTVSSTQPVLASQRVQYYQTFNEVAAG